MGTLGQYLREKRVARGVDLRDAAQQTRISLQYLKALEEENFSKLPGEVFVKGFLKNYARFLQLDNSEVMAKYEELRPPKTAVALPQGGEQTAGAAEQHPIKKSPIPVEPFVWAAGILIVFVIFIVLIMPSRHTRSAKTTAKSTQGGQEVISVPTATVGKPEKIYLEIVALENTWLLLRTDNSPQKKALLTKGESLTWIATERFQLSYGSAGALKLTLNGKELIVNEPKSAVVRDMAITASGIMSRKIQSSAVKPTPQRARQAVLFQQPRSSEQQQTVKPKQPKPSDPQKTVKQKPLQPAEEQPNSEKKVITPKPLLSAPTQSTGVQSQATPTP